MSVRQQLRASGLFARETEQNSTGTTTFYLAWQGDEATIFAQRNDEVFHIYHEEHRLNRFPNSDRLRAYLEAHAYRIGRPDSETESYYALHADHLPEVLRIIR